MKDTNVNKDTLIISTIIQFSLLDRVRLLFGRKARVHTMIDWPEVIPPHGIPETRTTVDRVFPGRNVGAGYEST